MGKIFPANLNRYDPYKAYRFLVYLGKSTTAVAAVSKVGAIKRSSDVIEYKEGGNAVILKGLGRTKYEPITLERGITQDQDFITFANYAQVLDQAIRRARWRTCGKKSASSLLNEQGVPVLRYFVHRCWVSEFRPCRIWMPVATRSRSSTSSSRTRAGSRTSRSPSRWRRDCAASQRPRVERAGADGNDELFVVEHAPTTPLPALLELARRVGGAASGGPLDWTSLPATDLDAAALAHPPGVVGRHHPCRNHMPGSGCVEPIDVSFGIADYIEHHRPRRSRSATVEPEQGWFRLAGAAVRFRVPTVADVLEATSDGVPSQTLSVRCIDAPELSAALARRLDRALASTARLAPRLDDLLGGACPECGHQVTIRFDPLAYTLAELRAVFSSIYLETHALAAAYGWPEGEILALPRSRRRRYAALVADERSVA